MAPVFLTRGDLKKELQRLQDSKRQQVGRLDASALERLELEIKTTQGRLTELEQLLQSEPHLVDMAAKLRDLDISPDPQRDQAAVSTASQVRISVSYSLASFLYLYKKDQIELYFESGHLFPPSG